MTEAKTVLVTGASGFIAKHICLKLLHAGHRVVGSARSERRGQEVVAAMTAHLTSDADVDQLLRTVTLDLDGDAGWDEAMRGVDVLMHTASPFPLEQPKDDQDLIRPAVNGTLRALRAAKSAGVKRVVLTSSIVAIVNRDLSPGKMVYEESDWSDLDYPTATPYVKSKTLAERAAWDFVEKEAPEIALTTINPGLVLGPPLDDHIGASLQVVQRLLRSKDPALPNFGFGSVDVRDIAEMHVRALSNDASIGQRIAGVNRFFWYIDMAKTLAAAYPDRKITTRRAPNWLVRGLALVDKPIRTILADLDQKREVSNQRARDLLGMEFLDVEQGLRDAADYLIAHGLDR